MILVEERASNDSARAAQVFPSDRSTISAISERRRCTGLWINAVNLHPWTVTLPRRAPRLRAIQVSGSPIVAMRAEDTASSSREEPQHHLLPPLPASLCDFVALETGSRGSGDDRPRDSRPMASVDENSPENNRVIELIRVLARNDISRTIDRRRKPISKIVARSDATSGF